MNLSEQFQGIERKETNQERELRNLYAELKKAEREVDRLKFLINHIDWLQN